MDNSERSPSRIGIVVGTLVLGGLVGFFVGRGTVPPLPPSPTPGPSTPTATVTPRPPASTCLTPGPQTINIGADGRPDCPSAFINNDQTAVWKTTPGSTLWVRFPNGTVFPKITCRANECNSDLPGSGAGSSSGKGYDYDINVFATTTPTPRSGSTTPTPQSQYGRIIIIKP